MTTGGADQDTEHLKILSICYYVFAGLSALGGCCALIYPIMGIGMLASPPSAEYPDAESAEQVVGGVFIVLGVLMLALSWTISFLYYLTGRYLREQRKRTFCLVMAGLSCLSVPLGTILGIFTLIVLQRPGVRARFEASGTGARPRA